MQSRFKPSLAPSTLAMSGVIGSTVLLTAILTPLMGLTFPAGDWLQPIAVCLGLAGVAAYYHRRNEESFVLCLKALIVLVSFSTFFAVLTYTVAATGRPFADERLVRCDTWLGFSAPAMIRWTHEHPAFSKLMWLCYFSVIPQTVLAIVYLGLTNQREILDRFLLRFMACGLLTVAVFYFLPAEGTCSGYGVAVPCHYQPILDHLEAMRSGSRTVVTWRDTEGLITFPSFHTVWGLLLILAFRSDRYLRWPMLLLNGLMVASTVPVGMHYLTDVLAAGAICTLVVAVEFGVARLASVGWGGGQRLWVSPFELAKRKPAAIVGK